MTKIPSALNKVFWGLLFVLIDFNINHFDILPDFIGYIIVVFGLSELVPFSHLFSKARFVAIVLAGCSIPAMFMVEINLLDGFQPSEDVFMILIAATILTLIHLVFIYFFLKGLMELAVKSNLPGLAEKTQKQLTAYMVVSLAVAALSPFALNLTDQKAIFLIFTSAIASFVVQIMVLALIRRFRSKFMSLKPE